MISVYLLLDCPCGKPLLLPAAAEFLLAALVFQDGDLSVYPCRETTVPLLGNTCTLTGKHLYPCRETLKPWRREISNRLVETAIRCVETAERRWETAGRRTEITPLGPGK